MEMPVKDLRTGLNRRLATAVAALADAASLELTSASERPWHSATFVGARHRFKFAQQGSDDHSLEALAQLIESHEFRLAGHLIADARVSREGSSESPLLVVEVLTVEES